MRLGDGYPKLTVLHPQARLANLALPFTSYMLASFSSAYVWTALSNLGRSPCTPHVQAGSNLGRLVPEMHRANP